LTISERTVLAALAEALAQRITAPRYQLWFASNTKFRIKEDHLVVGVPNLFLQEYLQNKFGDEVRAAAAEVLDRPLEIRFVIDPELFQAARREQTGPAKPEPKGGSPARPAAAAPADSDQRRPSRVRRWKRLSDFVVGPCNRLAHVAALSVVEAPGQEANPLVLHGPVGTGKTHLLEGIYLGLRKGHPDGRIVFLTAEDFTHRFVQAMRLGKLTTFRRHFREADALLVDDLNFLAGKRATQEEFLHTFNVLQGEGKQVVATCDCHPRLADDYLPELADRLLGGTAWGLLPPDPATRLALLCAKARSGEPHVPEAVLAFLAEQLRGNVRELEGALHSLRHYSRVTNQPIDLALARQALADLLRHAVRVLQLADVDRAVCRVLRLAAGALQAKQRAWAVSHPRMLAMYLARKHTTAPYSEIGQHFGGRNHSTVVAAEKKVRQWLLTDGELVLGEQRLRLREVIELVERELQR
jgi:chromosomal replication initiator protein